MGRSAEALANLNQALVVEPRNELALVRKGIVLGDRGDHLGAIEALSEVLEQAEEAGHGSYVNPEECLRAIENLGHSLTAVGDFQGARECYEQVLALAPHHTEVRRRAAALGVYDTRVETPGDVFAGLVARVARLQGPNPAPPSPQDSLSAVSVEEGTGSLARVSLLMAEAASDPRSTEIAHQLTRIASELTLVWEEVDKWKEEGTRAEALSEEVRGGLTLIQSIVAKAEAAEMDQQKSTGAKYRDEALRKAMSYAASSLTAKEAASEHARRLTNHHLADCRHRFQVSIRKIDRETEEEKRSLEQESSQLAQEADVATIAAANRAQQIRAVEAELANLRAGDALARAEAERVMSRREEVEMDRASLDYAKSIIPTVREILTGACDQMWSEHGAYEAVLSGWEDRSGKAWILYMERSEEGLHSALDRAKTSHARLVAKQEWLRLSIQESRDAEEHDRLVAHITSNNQALGISENEVQTRQKQLEACVAQLAAERHKAAAGQPQGVGEEPHGLPNGGTPEVALLERCVASPDSRTTRAPSLSLAPLPQGEGEDEAKKRERNPMTPSAFAAAAEARAEEREAKLDAEARVRVGIAVAAAAVENEARARADGITAAVRAEAEGEVEANAALVAARAELTAQADRATIGTETIVTAAAAMALAKGAMEVPSIYANNRSLAEGAMEGSPRGDRRDPLSHEFELAFAQSESGGIEADA